MPHDGSFRIHAGYVIVILAVAVVLLLTKELGDIPTLVDRVLFALALSSMVLAILTIVYSYVTNASISSGVVRIGDASTDIAQSAARLRGVAEELENRLGSVPDVLEQVHGKVDALLTSRGMTEETPSQREAKETECAPELSQAVLDRATHGGLLAAAVCSAAEFSGRSFRFSDALPEMGSGLENYVKAWTNALRVVGLVDYSRDEDGRLTVTRVHPQLSSQAVGELEKRMALESDEDWPKTMRGILDRMNAYFSGGSEDK